ncbi:hypothetical protein MMC28_009967 [Mycoblastus sanguinarius]|nr:hypothetical protein [Mycoblastus sanguinarius]
MSDRLNADEGQITKFDSNGNQFSSVRVKPIQFAYKAETAKCTQTFAFRGPDNSRHASRALDIVESMQRKNSQPIEGSDDWNGLPQDCRISLE